MGNLIYDILPGAIVVAVTLACFWGANLGFRGARPIFSAMLAALSIPALLLGIALLILFKPNPHHSDLPGMAFAACVMGEMFALPIGLVTSFSALVVLRRVQKRPS